MKICNKCHVLKELSEFYTRKDRNFSPIFRCKECVKAERRGNPSYSEYRMRSYRKDIAKSRAYVRAKARRLKYLRYGITLADYDRMLAEQNGRCAICERSPVALQNATEPMLHVDHSHESQLVRGLLCENCNRAIGLFKDDPRLLVRAAAYLTPRLEVAA